MPFATVPESHNARATLFPHGRPQSARPNDIDDALTGTAPVAGDWRPR